jgi:DamX protein
VPESPMSAEPDGRIAGRSGIDINKDAALLADYRQRYGLSADPFNDDPDFPLFTGAQRRELLDQLLHLCQFGNSLLVTLGARGTGKTRLANALLDSMAETDEICLITADADLGVVQLLGQITETFGLRRDGTETAGQLLASLRSFSQPIMGSNDLALVVIDDAHHLDDQTLGALLSLLQGVDGDNRRLHIALFAEQSLINRLDQLDMQDVLINDFYLESFTLHETVDYLNFRMEMADYLGPEVFTEALVDPWWRMAQGQLQIVHQYARAHLLESVLPASGNSRKPFPVVHIIAVAVLGAVFLMSFFYTSKDESPVEDDKLVSQSIPVNPIKPAVSNTSASAAVASSQSSVTDAEQSAPLAQTAIPVTDAQEQPAIPITVASSSVSVASVSSAPAAAAKLAEVVAATEKPETKISPAPKPRASLTEDEEILLSWRADEYTLQLLGVSSEKAARDYIASQPNRADLLLFRGERKGKGWFVVVSGRFSSSAQARQALATLPPAQQKAGPWPRDMKSIQAEIGNLPGAN